MRFTLRQLKSLRRAPVPPEALEAGRRRLVIVMAESPMLRRGGARFAFIWKPAFAALVVVVFVATSGGSIVYASQGSVPGDALYGVKIASESVRAGLALSPERRFAVQAAQAERRLEETRVLIERDDIDDEEREERVNLAIDAYERRLTVMNRIAEQLAEKKSMKPKRAREAVMAAERVLDRHVDLVASATSAQPAVAKKVLEPIDDAVDFEAGIFKSERRRNASGATSTDEDGGRDADLESHRRERTERLDRHLQELRFDLRSKALEIKAGM